tara:strand:- start:57 stop:230 length:174 start_codon:yes stop_codon:yes gene_type:complete
MFESDKKIKEIVDRLMGKFMTDYDLASDLRRMYLQGFDTVEDYEKYGDAFITVKVEA